MAAGEGLSRRQSTEYSRQEAIEDWDESKIREERALLLGVGGVGCSFGMTLARAGVSHIQCVDYDKVELSNLNRQVLFSKSDVGREKVEAALDCLRSLHSWRTSVDGETLDAVRKWGKVVEFAKDSTSIFNGCDYGSFFDYAVASLCRRLSLRYVAAITHSFIFQCDAFDNAVEGPCWGCSNRPETAVSSARLTELVDKYVSLDGKGEGCLVTVDEFHEILCAEFRVDHPSSRDLVFQALESLTIEGPPVSSADSEKAQQAKDHLSKCFQAYDKELLKALHPSNILSHSSIAFIPKEPAPTLSVGSYAGTCIIGSTFAVNMWLMQVMGQPAIHWSHGSLRTEANEAFAEPKWPIFHAKPEAEESCPLCQWAKSQKTE